jgi:ubiquinone/menaquinone biosynthesis C-methylase UbiE
VFRCQVAEEPKIATTSTFDPGAYKATTREQWQVAAEPWHRWGPQIERWLGEAREAMLDMARLHAGARVLDVAAGAGGQTLAAARRVGPTGSVLATDISANILEYAAHAAASEGLADVVATRVMDGEELTVENDFFDAAISRLGLIYFPDQQTALTGMRASLKPAGRLAAIVYSTPEANRFFSIPVSIIRRRAALPAPAPGQPGPFSLGDPGVIEAAYERAGFTDIDVRRIEAPLRMRSATECLSFERESFGALHQMLSGLTEPEREETWREIEAELSQFEHAGGFEAPCELLVAAGTAP